MAGDDSDEEDMKSRMIRVDVIFNSG